MRFTNKAMLRGLILGSSIFGLAACGGGGGGGVGGMAGAPAMKPADTYSVKITADRTALPLNIANDSSYVGSPYTTTLYIEGMINGQRAPIPGGEGTFSCGITSGFESGSFYYHDGDPSHYRKVTVPNPTPADPNATREIEIESSYRSVVLGANAGVGTVHFHSSKIAGTATIRCSTADPKNQKMVSDEISIVVGSDSNSKQPSQIVLKFQETLPFSGVEPVVKPMFVQGVNSDVQRMVQVEVLDEAGQRVPNPAPGKANVGARLLQTTEGAKGAILRSGSDQGQEITARTVNGLAQFTIVSGINPGSIVVEFYTDRTDNDVTNGIGFPVINRKTIQVGAPSKGEFKFQSERLPAVEMGKPYAHAIEVQGGFVRFDDSVPFVSFEVTKGALPAGVVLRKDGEISGTPTIAGEYTFTVRASQSDGLNTVEKEFTLIVYEPLKIVTIALPNATVNVAYNQQIQVSGGVQPYLFSKTGGSCNWATIDPASGVVTGTPTAAGSCTLAVTVTDDANQATLGNVPDNSVQKTFTITVNTP